MAYSKPDKEGECRLVYSRGGAKIFEGQKDGKYFYRCLKDGEYSEICSGELRAKIFERNSSELILSFEKKFVFFDVLSGRITNTIGNKNWRYSAYLDGKIYYFKENELDKNNIYCMDIEEGDEYLYKSLNFRGQLYRVNDKNLYIQKSDDFAVVQQLQ
ncbi:MAG: hypothetical protein Q8873_07655 [Bacillota bacterium]|nr:hypothetical protein [Bacillota bacterium]